MWRVEYINNGGTQVVFCDTPEEADEIISRVYEYEWVLISYTYYCIEG